MDVDLEARGKKLGGGGGFASWEGEGGKEDKQSED
jgi:hypothetical protein